MLGPKHQNIKAFLPRFAKNKSIRGGGWRGYMQGRQRYSQLASFGWNQKWNGWGKGWAVGGGGGLGVAPKTHLDH